jgi:hypothetical protein
MPSGARPAVPSSLAVGVMQGATPTASPRTSPSLPRSQKKGKAAKLVNNACKGAKMAESAKLSCWHFLMILLAICPFLIILHYLSENL